MPEIYAHWPLQKYIETAKHRINLYADPVKAALAIAVEPCNLRQPVLGRNISLGYFIDFDFYSYVSQIDHLGVAQFTRVPWQQTKLLTVGFPHDPGPKITINPQALMAAHQNQSITMPGSTIFSFTPQLDVWLRR